MSKLKIVLLAVLALIITFLYWWPSSPPTAQTPGQQTAQNPIPPAPVPAVPAPIVTAPPVPAPIQTPTVAPKTILTAPLSDALGRVTKKPFGLYVTPKNSPVSPERFQGYHTGADFETMPDEQNTDVPITAVCTGPLLMKKWATGYGGVAVQQCDIDKQAVTVVYGHLKLASIQPSVGDQMTAGQSFAVLGKGNSTETDGERKHLHLAIHKGTAINILGYVQKQSQLDQWLDPMPYFL